MLTNTNLDVVNSYQSDRKINKQVKQFRDNYYFSIREEKDSLEKKTSYFKELKIKFLDIVDLGKRCSVFALSASFLIKRKVN